MQKGERKGERKSWQAHKRERRERECVDVAWAQHGQWATDRQQRCGNNRDT